MAAKPAITAKRALFSVKKARELYAYDPKSGIVRHRKVVTGCNGNVIRPAGSLAGYNHYSGYRMLAHRRKAVPAHRVIFAIMTGRWPKAEIDHINGVKDDNRWANLREAERHQNIQNRGVRADNVVGLKGVKSMPNGHYQARIAAHLGTFRTPEAAHAAYRTAARTLHKQFANFDNRVRNTGRPRAAQGGSLGR